MTTDTQQFESPVEANHRLVLAVALVPGNGGIHMPRHLARHGVEVAFVGHPQAMAARSDHIKQQLAWAAHGRTYSFDPFLAAVQKLRPARIVPLDELGAVRCEQVGWGALPGSGMAFPEEAVQLVRRSLGDPAHYLGTLRRRNSHALATKAGVAVPLQGIVERVEDVLGFAAQHGYPVVLKREFSMGGMGVFVLQDEAGARAVCQEQRVDSREAFWVVQAFVEGTLGIHAVYAEQGQVLAQVSATQLSRRTGNHVSASSVVRLCRHPGMEQAAEAYSRTAGLSGFHAWDFILHGNEPPVLIEHNPRPISLTTLGGLLGRDLCAPFARQLGLEPQPDVEDRREADVALFPEEWRRDPASPWLHRGYVAAPWDDPALFAALLKSSHM